MICIFLFVSVQKLIELYSSFSLCISSSDPLIAVVNAIKLDNVIVVVVSGHAVVVSTAVGLVRQGGPAHPAVAPDQSERVHRKDGIHAVQDH
jgi:hypothetical protein